MPWGGAVEFFGESWSTPFDMSQVEMEHDIPDSLPKTGVPVFLPEVDDLLQ